jgi:hypothetical protein
MVDQQSRARRRLLRRAEAGDRSGSRLILPVGISGLLKPVMSSVFCVGEVLPAYAAFQR